LGLPVAPGRSGGGGAGGPSLPKRGIGARLWGKKATKEGVDRKGGKVGIGPRVYRPKGLG